MPPLSLAKINGLRAYLPRLIATHCFVAQTKGAGSMADLIWLAVLGGLFLLTLAFARLCDGA